ncbi:arylesterase [Thalassolituus sp. LLYu03]|uniref:arylesterase n=1 Tax=Thalassolituus sp. LLYu03 TaxID=3421656 RepID=UPI003D2A7A4B
MRIRYLLVLLLALPLWVRAEPVILVVGDSISAGFGIPVQQGWVALLEQTLQQDVPSLSVVNASISGDTTSGGLNRLPALLAGHKPALTLIELGGNDGLRGQPLARIRNNLQRMITLCHEAGSDVILLGMQIPPNYGPRYTEGFRDLYGEAAADAGTPLLPFLLQDIATRPALMQADGIHPTAEAQPIMTQAVLPLVMKWLNDR